MPCLELCIFNKALVVTVAIATVASEFREATYSGTGLCSTDTPHIVKQANKRKCALECLGQASCHDFNHNSETDECALFLHKPLFYDDTPGCAGLKASSFGIFNPVKRSGVRWLYFEVFSAIQV